MLDYNVQEGGFIANNFYNLKKRGFPVERLTKEMIQQRYPAWYRHLEFREKKKMFYVCSEFFVFFIFFSVRSCSRNVKEWNEGYFNKRGGWAESGRVVVKLAQKALRDGVRLLIGTVRHLIIEILDNKNTQRVKGVLLESGESIYGDFVLVAAGAWTPILLPHLRVHF